MPKGEAIGSFEDIAGFEVAVLVAGFSLTSYRLGQVCLPRAACPATRLRPLVRNAVPLPTHALFVGPRIPAVAEVAAGNYDIVGLQEASDGAGKRAVHRSRKAEKIPDNP